MIHVSPCGWYCFEAPNGKAWEINDSQEKTILSPANKTCVIELLCARKDYKAAAEEISGFHEDYLEQEGIRPYKTVFSENPYHIQFYVTRGVGPDECLWIIGHAFWNNYCVFMQFHSLIPQQEKDPCLQAYYDILQSLQPLVNS